MSGQPEQQYICKVTIQDSYFKKEKITVHREKYGSSDSTETTFSFWNEKWYASAPVNFTMRLKKCYGMKEKKDKTKVEIVYYIHTAYKKPGFGRLKYFVLFGYIQNPITGEWEIATDSNSTPDNITYRYEARLTFGIRTSKMVDVPWRM